MWELDHKESWAPKNWCFWTVVFEKTLESLWLLVLEKTLESLISLDCKEIKPINLKGNQSWIFIRRANAKAEALILGLPNVKKWPTGKDHDAGKDWRLEEKGTTGDKMVGWHHRFHGHESEQAPGVGNGQGGLACCSLWGHKESDTTEWLNWTLSKDETLLYYYCHYIHFVDGKTEAWKGKMTWKVLCKLPITPCMSLSQLIVPTTHWPAASRSLELEKMQGGWSALRKAQCTQSESSFCTLFTRGLEQPQSAL